MRWPPPAAISCRSRSPARSPQRRYRRACSSQLGRHYGIGWDKRAYAGADGRHRRRNAGAGCCQLGRAAARKILAGLWADGGSGRSAAASFAVTYALGKAAVRYLHGRRLGTMDRGGIAEAYQRALRDAFSIAKQRRDERTRGRDAATDECSWRQAPRPAHGIAHSHHHWFAHSRAVAHPPGQPLASAERLSHLLDASSRFRRCRSSTSCSAAFSRATRCNPEANTDGSPSATSSTAGSLARDSSWSPAEELAWSDVEALARKPDPARIESPAC